MNPPYLKCNHFSIKYEKTGLYVKCPDDTLDDKYFFISHDGNTIGKIPYWVVEKFDIKPFWFIESKDRSKLYKLLKKAKEYNKKCQLVTYDDTSQSS